MLRATIGQKRTHSVISFGINSFSLLPVEGPEKCIVAMERDHTRSTLGPDHKLSLSEASASSTVTIGMGQAPEINVKSRLIRQRIIAGRAKSIRRRINNQ
jgi:hypothetical protein